MGLQTLCVSELWCWSCQGTLTDMLVLPGFAAIGSFAAVSMHVCTADVAWHACWVDSSVIQLLVCEALRMM